MLYYFIQIYLYYRLIIMLNQLISLHLHLKFIIIIMLKQLIFN